jgi:hypothetical protein
VLNYKGQSIEVNLPALRFAKHNGLSAKDHHDLMLENIDEVADILLDGLKIHLEIEIVGCKNIHQEGPV